MLRANSTVLTGGLGNLVIATAELGGALLVSLLALAAPLAALALVLLFLWLAIRLIRQLFRRAPPPSGQR
jgi:flagellar biogenesis protein FliO